MSNRFEHDTCVTPISEGLYEGRIDRGWWIVQGPNGGYIAAMLVRAMQVEIADDTRTLRSITVHYRRPPQEGPARIATRIERSGRSLSTISARLEQPHPLDAALLVAYADAWPPAVFATVELPPLTGGVPTIDLTVHIRTSLPLDLPLDEFVFVFFRTRQVQDGFLEEDGEIWTRDGRLLAHSRQLGLAL